MIQNTSTEGKTQAATVIRVLFVCTGNICRSPTAEGVFRRLAADAGLEGRFHIDSAGTDSCHVGEAPDSRAIRIAGACGVPLDGQRARLLRAADFHDFDYIFAMDGGHFRELQRRAPPGHKAEIALFLAAAALPEKEVPDPWYGTEEDFARVFSLVEKGACALLQKIRDDHGL